VIQQHDSGKYNFRLQEIRAASLSFYSVLKSDYKPQ
jgi:hypothetical protein